MDGDERFTEHGRAAQLPQYDDITIRNMEVINAAAALQNNLTFGATNSEMYYNFKTFHFYFAGLYYATNLETETYLKDKKEGVKNFVTAPMPKLPYPIMNDNRNRDMIITAINSAIDRFDEYQEAMKKAGFRKITYYLLKPDYAAGRSL